MHRPTTPQSPDGEKTRVVLFGSFQRGYHILNALLNDKELMKKIEIVGVATDDPYKSFVSPQKRVWRYLEGEALEDASKMVESLAKRHGIPVFKGKVKSNEFYEMLEKEWKPDIAYMGTFGQRLDNRIIHTPKMGTFNAHPSDGETWPSCVGPDPFEQMFKANRNFCAITLHKTNDKFDDGEMCAMSPRIPMPHDDMKNMDTGEKVVHMHTVTSPYAGQLVTSHLRSQIEMPLDKKIMIPSEKFQLKIDSPDSMRMQQRDGWDSFRY